MNYLFSKEHISQHMVKFGIATRPPIAPDTEKPRLTDYCNWLIEHFPLAFETLVISPNQLQVQKSFALSNDKRVEMPTFQLAGPSPVPVPIKGPVFTFPRKIYIDQIHEINIPSPDEIFHQAIHQLRIEFPDRAIPQISIGNQFVFDTGEINSLDILTSILKYDTWQKQVNNLALHLETQKQDKNITIDIKPTYLRRISRTRLTHKAATRFGIMVNVDIKNPPTEQDLTTTQIHQLADFAHHYIADELIKFLNNEG